MTRKTSNSSEKQLDAYPEKISPSIQALLSKESIRKQFCSSPLEKKTIGTKTPFEEGKNAFGIYGIERIYRDRLVITPTLECFCHCRYCYRKDRVMTKKRQMTQEEIDLAIKKIKISPEINNVLITGGDPFTDTEKLFYLLDKLMQVDTVQQIRIGTRSLFTRPEIFTKKLIDKICSYPQRKIAKMQKAKSLALNVHFNHSDELTDKTLFLAKELTSRGVILRNQAVLLKGVNDSFETLHSLHCRLVQHSILPYYLSHCDPVIGADHLRTNVADGLKIYEKLMQHSSTILPFYIVDLPVGKMRLFPQMNLHYVYLDNKRYIAFKTCYLAKDFKEITGKKELPPLHEETADGYILAYYLDGQN